MEKITFNRAYLETLSTTDLVSLADKNGIDIPEGLNRQFVIGELLELNEDDPVSHTDGGLVDTEFTNSPEALPETYNETQITILLRDPGWVFVYWDFHSSLFSTITANHHFECFFLRVNSFPIMGPASVLDFFDINVTPQDRKWYVHFPEHNMICRVDLYARNIQDQEQLLARSAGLVMPCSGICDAPYETRRKYPPLVELSGIAELRMEHFRNHRQSFT